MNFVAIDRGNYSMLETARQIAYLSYLWMADLVEQKGELRSCLKSRAWFIREAMNLNN